MPKRKSNHGALPASGPGLSISSFDAALDILACETFTRLDNLTKKFEGAAGVKLNHGVVRSRWEEAVKRYWVMKSMDELCCTAATGGSGKRSSKAEVDGEVKMRDETQAETSDHFGRDAGRPLPVHHPGPVVVHGLTPEEEHEWRKWAPKVEDVVLLETAGDGVWPGKIIDKKAFFQGRSVPRGNHFFPVRIYNEDMPPTITIKSRLIPLHLRPTPPLLASPALLSAYHQAANPSSFDMMAAARESLAGHNRTHPGVGDEPDRATIKTEKDAWNKQVNWVMNERRGEKLRLVTEEREKRLREVAKADVNASGLGEDCVEANEVCDEDVWSAKKRRMGLNGLVPAPASGGSSGGETDKSMPQTPWSRDNSPAQSIFGPCATLPCTTPRRTASPSLASYIRPGLATPQRPLSPRRLAAEKRRNGVFCGIGEYSPRGVRGGTYTPPRILPSGDETAPRSPAPSGTFDFVSPLGPVRLGKLTDGDITIAGYGSLTRKGSLEAVKEEPEDTDGWTVVGKKARGNRAGSLPCAEKTRMGGGVEGDVVGGVAEDEIMGL